MEWLRYATCPDELTALLAEEIAALGGREVRTGYRVVYFSASQETAYTIHLCSRLASRLYQVLKVIPAHSPTIIFDKARRIRFHQHFAPALPVAIQVAAASATGAIPNHLIGSKLREAVNDCFWHHLQLMPNQSSYQALVGIKGYFHHKRLMVSLDTSLQSLHRRGYRVEGHPAPLKETLAAALLAVCGYDGSVPFLDPMCGSGTIAIEAAQIATCRAPQLLRPPGGFGFEHLLDFDAGLWQAVRQRAQARIRPAPAEIFAADIDPSYVALAAQAAARAGLQGALRFAAQDFFQSERPAERGLLIANIPYGLRMSESEVSAQFLGAVGDHLKRRFKGWRCGLLVPASSPLKAIGLRPQRQLSLQNGTVPVKLLVFEIY